MSAGVLRGITHYLDVGDGRLPSNPAFDGLTHAITMAVTWDQVLEYILEPHALLPPLRKPAMRSPSRVFHRTFIRGLQRHRRVFTANPAAAEYTMQYMWKYCRAAVFVSVRQGRLELFVPFCNAQYENTWPEGVRSCLEPSKTGLPPQHWWLNGWVVCDQVPDQIWGDHWLSTLRDMVQTCCLDVDGDFVLNKRDTPLVRKDGGDPMNPFCYMRVVDPCKLLPVYSFYTGPYHLDIACPIGLEWMTLRQQSFPQARLQTPLTPLTDTYWDSKEDMVVFRGSTTGTGQRVHVFTCPSKWLDAKCTGNNRRRRIDPNTLHETVIANVPSSRTNYVDMNTQQQTYKYALWVNGHSAPDRAARLFNGSQVVLMAQPAQTDIGAYVWFSPLLQPMLHYVPVEHDLRNLDKKVQWLNDHDAHVKRMLAACSQLPLHMQGIKEWWYYARS